MSSFFQIAVAEQRKAKAGHRARRRPEADYAAERFTAGAMGSALAHTLLN